MDRDDRPRDDATPDRPGADEAADAGHARGAEHATPPGRMRAERGAGAGDRDPDAPGAPEGEHSTVEAERARRERLERLQAEHPERVAAQTRSTDRERLEER